MATHDYVIDNSTGANVRADINNALLAIVSNNSNSSSPSTTYAYQWWADTSNNVLKIRNSANNAWIELLQLDGTLTLEDGSASTPALAFRDDLNTGIFSSAADTFNVATAGVERMELGATTIFNESGADVDFRIEGDSEANLFYVDAGNDRIGIGTNAPSVTLDIESTSPAIRLTDSDASGTPECQISGGGGDLVLSADRDNEKSSTVMQFQTDGSTAMTIDSNQRIGIGTTSPSQELTLAGSDPVISVQEASVSSQVDIGTGSATGFINIQKADGTRTVQLSGSTDSYFTGGSLGAGTASPAYALDVRSDSTTAYSSSSSPSNVVARIQNGSVQNDSHAALSFNATNSNSAVDFWWITIVAQSQNYNGALAFSTRTSASVSQEVARLTNGRSFLVGTTATLNLGANNVTGIVLENNGRITAARSGAAAAHFGRQSDNGEVVLFACQGTNIVGSIDVTTTSAVLVSGSSDRRTKKNFEDWTEDTLSLFKNLKPQKFNFIIEDDEAEKTKGYIAQDLVDSFPEAYPKNSEDKYMFAPQGMIVYLMKAIQELEAKVAALESA